MQGQHSPHTPPSPSHLPAPLAPSTQMHEGLQAGGWRCKGLQVGGQRHKGLQVGGQMHEGLQVGGWMRKGLQDKEQRLGGQ